MMSISAGSIICTVVAFGVLIRELDALEEAARMVIFAPKNLRIKSVRLETICGNVQLDRRLKRKVICRQPSGPS